MTDELKELANDADAYRLALLGGLVQASQVIAWADRHIERTTSPSIEMIDLSQSQRSGIGDTVSLLRRLGARADAVRVSQRIFTWMSEALDQDPKRLAAVVRTLELMAIEAIAPDERARSEMLGFDDSLRLAINGTHGSPENVLEDVRRFLRRYTSSGAA